MEGPICADMVFWEQRPKSHYRKNGALKPDAPSVPTKAPDLDKLVRSVGDALNGIVWRDDSQVATLVATKRYTVPEQPCIGVRVRVYINENW